MQDHDVSPLAWERMVTAVEKVRDRLRRAAQVLEKAGIAYAVVGGNAIAAWVGEIDEAAVRNTQDVDVMLRREDFERAKAAFAQAGFVHKFSSGIQMFLDGPGAKARDAVHILFAGEKVRKEDLLAAPDVGVPKSTPTCKVLNLQGLVQMKLTSYRRKDQVHLLDLIEIGLLDQTWVDRFPDLLGQRLQELLDNPEG